MTTASAAYTALRTRLEGGSLGLPLRWQNEDADSDGNVMLPDTPSAFIYTEFNVEHVDPVSFGSGAGGNTYRNYSILSIWIFVPRGDGLTPALNYAETAAELFRSYRTIDVSCFEAGVIPGGDGAVLKPAGLQSAVDNYFWSLADINLWFDTIG